MPTETSGGYALITAIPRQDPSNPAVGRTIDRLRAGLPAGSLIGGAVAENRPAGGSFAKTPLVIGVVLALGFLLLVDRAAGIAACRGGSAHEPIGHGAAFSVAKFGSSRTGALHSLLGFQSQGFLDAWGPVFFFAMIFAISMDYTVLPALSSAKEHGTEATTRTTRWSAAWARSGRVIFAAGGGDGRGVLHLRAWSGPLPPREMGITLGVAVLLDAALIRLPACCCYPCYCG